MAAEPSLNVAELLREHLQSASPDLLRTMVKTFADVLTSAEVGWVAPFPQHAPVEPRRTADIAKPLRSSVGSSGQSISHQRRSNAEHR
jgi:hypothetical protein